MILLSCFCSVSTCSTQYLFSCLIVQLMTCSIDLCLAGFLLSSCCSKHVVELYLVNWPVTLKCTCAWGLRVRRGSTTPRFSLAPPNLAAQFARRFIQIRRNFKRNYLLKNIFTIFHLLGVFLFSAGYLQNCFKFSLAILIDFHQLLLTAYVQVHRLNYVETLFLQLNTLHIFWGYLRHFFNFCLGISIDFHRLHFTVDVHGSRLNYA